MQTEFIGPILFFLIQLTIPAIDSNTVHVNRLSSEKISLEKRHSEKAVNEVFKDNILLNLAYLNGKVKKKDEINWDEVKKPFSYKFFLLSKQTFAFHEDVLPKYKGSVVKTTNANFNFGDGFKSDGYLAGDGICHLASLIYWVAKNAKLEVFAPTNHDFAAIPEISKEYGVSIYKMPGNVNGNALQNLYITNNKKNSVMFEFLYRGSDLKFSIYEVTKNSF
ncbi:MAG: VanW family protein [Candidatus Levybacteria bacterium]|nr:VanW family protein [Candidatus Levybacteria bacterium]